MQKTYMAKTGEIPRKWFIMDANNQVLGRMASTIAMMLMGKNYPQYTPHADVGDFVVVINAEKIKVTGSKEKKKLYYRYSGYPGGLKTRNLAEQRAFHPTDLLKLAVRRMLPKTTMGDHMLKKLKIYTGTTHPHAAQCPQVVKE